MLYFLTGGDYMHIPRLVSVPALLLACAAISVAQTPTRASQDPKAPQTESFACPMQGLDVPADSPCSKEQLFEQSLKNWASSAVHQLGSACYAIRDYRFSREGDSSAFPKLKDYSTCERASLFELRDAAVPKK